MVVEWLVGVFANIATWFVGLIPQTDPLPAQIANFDDTLGELLDLTSGMNGWLDWGYGLTVAGLVVGAWLLALAVRGVRWVISLAPTMSGGT